MSFQEKRAIVSALGSVLITGLYSAYMAPRYPAVAAYAPEVFRFWGAFFLFLVPVSVVAKIVVHILFSILNTVATREEEPPVTDERDRLIDLKATRNGLVVFSLGFLAAMGTLALSQPPAAMFVIFIGAGVLSELVSDLSQFVYYRRGF